MSETKKNVENLKVFMVDVEVSFQIPVVAASKKDAQEIAGDMWEDDFKNGNEPDVSSVHATEITSTSDDHKHTLPYGIDDDHPRHDWTIDQWIEAQKQDPSG